MLWQANPTLGYEEDQVAVADLHAWQEESQLFSRFGFVVNDAPEIETTSFIGTAKLNGPGCWSTSEGIRLSAQR